MTMPSARSLEVDGRGYHYVLRGKGRRLPTGALRLVVEFRPKRFVTCIFVAGAVGSRGFAPADVSNVVRALQFHQGTLPVPFITGGWKLAAPDDEGAVNP